MTYYGLCQSCKVLQTAIYKKIYHIYCKENGKEQMKMNETLYDLEQKRKAVEQDIQALYETLQKEVNEQKKIWEILFSHISFFL